MIRDRTGMSVRFDLQPEVSVRLSTLKCRWKEGHCVTIGFAILVAVV